MLFCLSHPSNPPPDEHSKQPPRSGVRRSRGVSRGCFNVTTSQEQERRRSKDARRNGPFAVEKKRALLAQHSLERNKKTPASPIAHSAVWEASFVLTMSHGTRSSQPLSPGKFAGSGANGCRFILTAKWGGADIIRATRTNEVWLERTNSLHRCSFTGK